MHIAQFAWPILEAVATGLLIGLVPAQDAPLPGEMVTLDGRVLDMRGEGVAVAEVAVGRWDRPGEVSARTFTDGEGLFRVRAPRLPLGEMYVVSAAADGSSRATAHAFGPDRPVLITVHDAVVLRGTLLDATGKPRANVPVMASSMAEPLRDCESTATTDADGNFELRHVAVGPTVVTAYVAGLGLLQARLCAVEDAVVALVPNTDAQTSLHVSIEGLPEVPDGTQPRALLMLSPNGGGPLGGLPRELRILAIGREGLRLEHLPDWNYVIDCRRAGHAVAPEWNRLERGKGPHELKLKVTPTVREEASMSSVAAIVRTPTGETVPGVPLLLFAFGAGVRVEASSDASGHVKFACPLSPAANAMVTPSGEEWINAGEFRDGHSGALVHKCVIDPDAVLDIRVVKACSIAGRVTLPSGRPAAFVQLELQELLGERSARWTGVEEMFTAADGTFRLPPQVARRNDVRVRIASPSGSATSPKFRIDSPGTRCTDLELQLGAPAVIEGVVQEANGRPAVGVVVRVRYGTGPRGAAEGSGYLEVVTDKRGRYRVAGVVPGEAMVHIVQDGRIPDAGIPVQAEAGATQQLELSVPATGR